MYFLTIHSHWADLFVTLFCFVALFVHSHVHSDDPKRVPTHPKSDRDATPSRMILNTQIESDRESE